MLPKTYNWQNRYYNIHMIMTQQNLIKDCGHLQSLLKSGTISFLIQNCPRKYLLLFSLVDFLSKCKKHVFGELSRVCVY